MKDFLYIFRDTLQNTEAYMKLSPAEIEADMQRWNAWMTGLAESGNLGTGQPLLPEGKVVKGPSKKITDGPYVEGKDIVGGYMLIKAKDLQQATELSKGCPALLSPGGTVEVREIMPM
jgi:hypothetical protein